MSSYATKKNNKPSEINLSPRFNSNPMFLFCHPELVVEFVQCVQ